MLGEIVLKLKEKDCSVILTPFVKWAGGKSQLTNELEKMLFTDTGRVFTKYCEPMIGGGALFFDVLTKYDFKELYIGDINSELINSYKVIKNNVEELIAQLKELRLLFLSMDADGRKHFYYETRDKFNGIKLCDTTNVSKAAYFIFLNKTCYNGLYRVNRSGLFNVPMGAYKNPVIFNEENLRKIHAALQGVTIVCGDYSLSEQFIDKNTFVYFDPPYRPLSNTATFTAYNSYAFNDNEQIRLAKFVDQANASGAKILLSNSDSKNINPTDTFFDELYREYNIKRISATRTINSKSEYRGKISELLIYN